MKRSPIIRRRLYRPPTHHADPVDPTIRMAVLNRDGGCVAVRLGEPPSDCWGRLTLDHVRDEGSMGLRAPSDRDHLVSLCEGHHLDTRAGANWATSHRPALRAYLTMVNG